MLLKTREDRQIVKVADLDQLQNPFEDKVQACPQQGEEEQPPQPFGKSGLMFPSGEALPRCWLDPHYRDEELERLRRRNS